MFKKSQKKYVSLKKTFLCVTKDLFLQADCSDFVMVPGSSVLMSHSELMAISGSKSSGSLQLLPISESKAGSPAPSEPCNDRPGSRGGVVPMVATVREEEEEEVEVAGRRDEASQVALGYI